MQISDKAKQIHKQAIIFDLHSDTLMVSFLFKYKFFKKHKSYIPTSPLLNHIDYYRLQKAKVSGLCMGCVPNPFFKSLGSVIGQIKIAKKLEKENPDKFKIIKNYNDLQTALNKKIFAAILTIEGAHSLEGNLNNVDLLYNLGIRSLTLVHFSKNAAAFPAKGYGDKINSGLTDFGRALVKKLEVKKIIVDLAHINKPGFIEAAKLCTKPFIVSHTGIKGVNNLWRNIDDEQLKAVAEKNGVVGIIFSPFFLASKFRCSAEKIIEHIDYVVKKIGIDYVALGSDFDGFIHLPDGIKDISSLPVITQLLLDREYKEEETKKILGENFLRVAKNNF